MVSDVGRVPLGLAGRDGRVQWLFTHRHGGVSSGVYDSLNLATGVGDEPSAVEANRVRVADYLSAHRLVVMNACHGTTVAVVTDDLQASVDEVDGLVTTQLGVAVAALSADCLPVLLYDVDSGIVGAVHSGWVGVRDDVVGVALDTMKRLGATQIRAVIGPSICGNCYAVPPDRVDEVAARIPEARARAADGQPSLDLAHGMQAHLARAGVISTRVPVCTAESADHYSYRRDGVTGRLAGVIVLDPPTVGGAT